MIDIILNRKLVPLLLVFLLAGLPGIGAPPDRESVEQAYQPKRLALVIGINDFLDSKWGSLLYARKDALDMSAALKDRNTSGFDLVIELTEPWQTTKVAIDEAFKHLSNKNMSTEDTVLIYFSTHGTLAKNKEFKLRQYLVNYNTEFEKVSETAIDVAELIKRFNGLTSRRKVLIMASCHSGMGKSSLPEDIALELSALKSGFFVKPVEFASEASMIIGVCSWGETAREDADLENDIYTHFFLKGMTMYDRNQDGAISVSEAHDFAQRNTYYYTKGSQRPFVRSDILGTDPIILSGKVNKTGLPVLLSYSGRLDGARISINGREKGVLPDGFTTTPGWNRIEAFNDKGDPIFNGLLYVRQGERLDMDRLVEARSDPNLGLVTNYRMFASEQVSEIVLPGTAMLGLAYRIGAFPTMDTSVHIETSYGRNQWDTRLDAGDEANMSVEIVEANAALLYSYRKNQADYFVGPLVGAFGMLKEVEMGGETDRFNSGTVYPGIIGGVRFRSSPDMHFELSNRLSYNLLTVEGKSEGALVNEVSATLYFSPDVLFSNFQSDYQDWRWKQSNGLVADTVKITPVKGRAGKPRGGM